jgi:hypothetical protein
MFDAAALLLKDNKMFQKELRKIKAKNNPKSLFEFSNYAVWKTFCAAVKKDKAAIDSASRITGVESRMIVMCLVGEQVRMFNANRERFKQYVYPFSNVILPKNRGYGVTSILEHTALQIEQNLINPKSQFYPGDYFYKCLNTTDAAPGLVIDSIKAHQHKTIQRLIMGGDHFYSYLYTAFLIRQYQAHWQREGQDSSGTPIVPRLPSQPRPSSRAAARGGTAANHKTQPRCRGGQCQTPRASRSAGGHDLGSASAAPRAGRSYAQR